MVKGERRTVKKEVEGDVDTIAGVNLRSPKADLDDDDIPLAVSTERRKKKAYNPPKESKEEAEDDEDEKPLKRNKFQKKISKPEKLKMEDPVDSEEENEGEKVVKKNKKRKRNEEEVKVAGKIRKTAVSHQKDKKEKKEKKVYKLPGQKHDPPEIRDPLRIFYETLYQKLPTSEMAAFWMLDRGLLPLEVAEKVYEKKLLRNQHQKLGSPAKLVSLKKSPAVSAKKTTSKTVLKTLKKLKAYEEDDDNDNEKDDDFMPQKNSRKKRKFSS